MLCLQLLSLLAQIKDFKKQDELLKKKGRR